MKKGGRIAGLEKISHAMRGKGWRTIGSHHLALRVDVLSDRGERTALLGGRSIEKKILVS